MGNAQQSEAKKLTLDDFELVRLIGKGAFGKVWMVRRKEFGDIFAMKVLHKQSVVDQNLIEHTLLERDVMLMCNNPFIINLYWSFQTEENLYFVVDFIGGGSLWNQLCDDDKGYFNEEHVRFYASEIILGIEELHSKGIVYRDLKPENILINTDGHIVLTDFGLSANLTNTAGKVHSFSGTAIYIAPEVLLEEGHNHAVDWWSFGVVLYLLLAGEPPFWSENKKELFDMIKSAQINLKHRLLQPNARDLIGKLLNRDASVRLGSKEGASELKKHPFFAGTNWNKVMKKKLKPPYIPSTELILKSSSISLDSLLQQTPTKTKTCIEQFKGFSFTREAEALSTSDEIKKMAQTFTDEIPIVTRKRKMKKRAKDAQKKKSVEVVESELNKLQLLREQASRDNRNRTFINLKPQPDFPMSITLDKGRSNSIAQHGGQIAQLSPTVRSRSISLGSGTD